MFIVTIAALVMSASLGWFAYRLMREEQRRSEARVAVLTAALDGRDPHGFDEPRQAHVGFAAPPPVPAPVARTRTSPDVVYLEDDSRQVRAFRSERGTAFDDAPTIDAPLTGTPAPEQEWITSPPQPVAVPQGEPVATLRVGALFGDAPEAPTTDMRRFIALGGLVLVSLIAVGYLLFGRSEASSPTQARVAAPAEPVTATGVPLELQALSHTRTGDVIAVRGRVQNPIAGSMRTGLVASVMLLDQAGGFLGSARTAVDMSQLRPGSDASFTVQLPAHKDGRRYRVTFRDPDGALVPHVDKR